MKEIIQEYFKAWIINDITVIDEVFSKNINYSECYGPEYRGIEQVKKWFKDWHEKGTVLEWEIKRTLIIDNTIIVEWFFKCDYVEIQEFDGVTIAEFNDDKKICSLKEFQSSSCHYFPYEVKL